VRKAYADDDHTTLTQARRYLRFLAKNTDQAGRIAWWRMHLLVPKTVAFRRSDSHRYDRLFWTGDDLFYPV